MVIIPTLIELRSNRKIIGIVLLILVLLEFPIVHRSAKWVRGYLSTHMQHHFVMDGYGWRPVGMMLAETLPPDTRIPVTAAGAIPYYSRLFSVDMLGLNDRQIAREGRLLSTTTDGVHANPTFGCLPGHNRVARYEHVENRMTNLLIIHPLIVFPASEDEMRASIVHATRDKSLWREFLMHPWENHQSFDFVLLPFKKLYLVALYSHKNDELDELFESGDFPMFTIQRDEWMAAFSPGYTEYDLGTAERHCSGLLSRRASE